MDGTEHCDRRGQLVAAIHRLPLDRLDAGEAIGVFNAYLGMDEHNIDILPPRSKPRLPPTGRASPPLPQSLVGSDETAPATHEPLSGTRRGDPGRYLSLIKSPLRSVSVWSVP